MSTLRKLKRRIARDRMRKAGLRRVCKHDIVRDQYGMLRYVESYFANNWRDYI